MDEFPDIPGYKIEGKLGQGPIADVYLAVKEEIEQKVVIKVLIPDLAQDKEFAERFLSEARRAAKLDHPHIVKILDIGETPHHYYFVMEYFQESLRNRIINRQLSTNMIMDTSGDTVGSSVIEGVDPYEVFDIFRQLFDTLNYTYEEEAVHGDLRPENIFLREDHTPVIVDFFMSRILDASDDLEKKRATKGFVHYTSPEQILKKPTDISSDIYSLGVILYEMLTGEVPFDAKEVAAIEEQHIKESIPQLPEHFKLFQPLIDRMMAKAKEERAQSGAELILMIEEMFEEIVGKKNKVKELVEEEIETEVEQIEEVKDAGELQIEGMKEAEEVPMEKVKDAGELLMEEVKDAGELRLEEMKEAEELLMEEVKDAGELQIEGIKEAEELPMEEVIDAREFQIEEVKEAEELQMEEVKEAEELQMEEMKEAEELPMEEVKEVEGLQMEGVKGVEEEQVEEVKEVEEEQVEVEKEVGLGQLLKQEIGMGLEERTELAQDSPRRKDFTFKQVDDSSRSSELLEKLREPRLLIAAAAAIVIIVLLVIFFGSLGGDSETKESTEPKQVLSAEEQQEIEIRYTRKFRAAQNAFKAGKYEEALQRVTQAEKIKTSKELETLKQKTEAKIAENKESQAFQKASKINTKASYEEYLSKYSSGHRAEEAQKKIEELDRLKKKREADRKKWAASRVKLRSVYKTLTIQEIRDMVIERGFFEKYYNKTGNFRNHYESQTINNHKIIIDYATGLIWHQAGSVEPMDYQQAQLWMKELNLQKYAGYSDWRLPTMEEAVSLIESGESKYSLYIDSLFSREQKHIWTGDKFGNDKIWAVDFFSGDVNRVPFHSESFVRPVRSKK